MKPCDPVTRMATAQGQQRVSYAFFLPFVDSVCVPKLFLDTFCVCAESKPVQDIRMSMEDKEALFTLDSSGLNVRSFTMYMHIMVLMYACSRCNLLSLHTSCHEKHLTYHYV